MLQSDDAPDFGELPATLRAELEADQAELDAVQHLALFSLAQHLFECLGGAVDVGLHGRGGVDHEHHRRVVVGDAGVALGRRRCGCCRGSGVARDRGHLHDAYPVARLEQRAGRLQHRQQVELVFEIDELFGLGRNHGVAGAECTLGGNFLGEPLRLGHGVVGVDEAGQAVTFAKEQHALTVAGRRERQRDGVAPGHGVGLGHVAGGLAIAAAAYQQPGLAALVLALVDEEHAERIERLAAGGAGAGGQRGAGACQHALEQRGLAVQQQRLARLRPGSAWQQQRTGAQRQQLAAVDGGGVRFGRHGR